MFTLIMLIFMGIDLLIGASALIVGLPLFILAILVSGSAVGQGYEPRYCLFYGQTYEIINLPDFADIIVLFVPLVLIVAGVILLTQAFLYFTVALKAEKHDELTSVLRNNIVLGGLCVLFGLCVPPGIQSLGIRIEQAQPLATCALTPVESATLLRFALVESAPLIIGIGIILLIMAAIYAVTRPSRHHIRRPITGHLSCAVCGLSSETGCALCHAGLRLRVQDRTTRNELLPLPTRHSMNRTQIISLDLIPEGADAARSSRYRVMLNWNLSTKLETVRQESSWSPRDKEGREWIFNPSLTGPNEPLHLDLIPHEAAQLSSSQAFGLELGKQRTFGIRRSRPLRVTVMMRPEHTSTVWSQPLTLEFDV